MGFNFGAFAAGAVSGAGDIMEKQHKETKDSIDSNMKFAYEQGLPFHRQRKKDLRRLEGYASTLRNFQLSPDQVSAVMGNSEDFIKDFITRSTAETQATGGKFDVASQITMPDNAKIRDWRGVHLGTVNLPEVNQPTQPVNTSLLGKIMGTNSTGNSTGFNNLVDRTKQEMSSITGTPYDEVAAAGQGAYTYNEGTESTISTVNTSAERAAEYASLQLKNLQETSPIELANLVRQSKRAVTLEKRQDATYKLTKIREEYEAGLLGDRIKSGIDSKLLAQELEDLVYKQMIQGSGSSASQGLYLNTLGLMDEQAKDNPDPEKIKLFTDNQDTMRLLIAEQYNTEAEGKLLNISYTTYETTFTGKVDSMLRDVVSDDGLWIISKLDATKTFDYSSTRGKIEAEKIRKVVASEMIQSFRTMAKNGQPTSPALKMWLTMNKYFDERLVTLPNATSNTPDDEIDPAQSYSFSQMARPPKDAVLVDDLGNAIPKGSTAKPKGYQVPTGRVIKGKNVMSGTMAIPTHTLWKVFTGKAILVSRAGNRGNTGGANTGGANTGGANVGGANVGGANVGGANTGGANTGGANTGGANTGGANTGKVEIQTQTTSDDTVGWWDNPEGIFKDKWFTSNLGRLFSTMSANVTNVKEAKAQVETMVADNKEKLPTENSAAALRINSMNDMYRSLKRNGQGNMTPDRYKNSINLLIKYSVNSRHIAWAMNELADLPAE